MVSRRTFLKYTGSTMLTLFGFDKLSGIARAIAAIPGGTLDPNQIKKFKTPLFTLSAMPKAGKIKLKGGKTADYYEISIKQFSQQILPTGLPATTVWATALCIPWRKRHSSITRRRLRLKRTGTCPWS